MVYETLSGSVYYTRYLCISRIYEYVYNKRNTIYSSEYDQKSNVYNVYIVYTMASPFVIPGDVIRLIFSHLGLVELGRACRAGKRLKTLLYPVIENRHLYMRLGKKEILLCIISMITEANEFEISLLWIPLQVLTLRFNTVNEKYTLNTCSEAYSPRKRDKKFYLIETKREVCLLITRLLETTRYCISTDLATLRLLYDRRVQYGVES